MKRIIPYIFIILFLLTLSACGNREQDTHEPVTGIKSELLIDDIEYLLYVLENNFALMDAANWIRGVDVRALGQDVIQALHETAEMDAAAFVRLLLTYFAPLLGFGHFYAFSPYSADLYIPDDELYDYFLTYLFNLEEYELMQAEETLLPRMGREMTAQFLQAIRDMDIEVIMYLTQQGLPPLPKVSSEIIQYGHIAYIAMRQFTHGYTSYRQQVFEFLQEIRDYEHLIIDLRGNSGGCPTFFYNLIVAPIIGEPHQAKGFAFFQSGSYVERHIPTHRAATFYEFTSPRAAPYSISQLLKYYPLPELNLDDIYRLEYGFIVHTTINPRNFSMFDFQPAFTGKVWMLTDNNMTSGGQIAAWFAYDSGFATLVGDTTGGVFGGPRAFTQLPNSEITVEFDVFYVTNRHGRPLEAGTVPHYFNRPGMNALETALALIGES